MQLLKTDSMSSKPNKPAPVPGPPDAPSAPSSASVAATPPAKSTSLPPSASQPPQAAPAAPAEAGQGLREQRPPLVEGTGAKEEYGYIVTNQRSALDQIQLSFLVFIANRMLKYEAHLFLLSQLLFAEYEEQRLSMVIMMFFLPSPLSLYDGVKLLELLADKIHLTTNSFINIR